MRLIFWCPLRANMCTLSTRKTIFRQNFCGHPFVINCSHSFRNLSPIDGRSPAHRPLLWTSIVCLRSLSGGKTSCQPFSVWPLFRLTTYDRINKHKLYFSIAEPGGHIVSIKIVIYIRWSTRLSINLLDGDFISFRFELTPTELVWPQHTSTHIHSRHHLPKSLAPAAVNNIVLCTCKNL